MLNFEVRNKIGNYQKDETGGIGLSNVEKRLALIYGNEQKLQIDTDDELFSVKLTVRLHE